MDHGVGRRDGKKSNRAASVGKVVTAAAAEVRPYITDAALSGRHHLRGVVRTSATHAVVLVDTAAQRSTDGQRT